MATSALVNVNLLTFRVEKKVQAKKKKRGSVPLLSPVTSRDYIAIYASGLAEFWRNTRYSGRLVVG